MKIKRPVSGRPIPRSAARVFGGIIFDVYQWEQKMFDGTYKTFEKVKRRDTVNVIPVTSERKLILSEEQQPGMSPFVGVLGGRIDEGESPMEAAIRELHEEAGITGATLDLWFAEQFIEKVDWAVYTFIAKDFDEPGPQRLDSGEKIKLIYLTFEEFLDAVRDEDYRDIEIALKVFRLSKSRGEIEGLKRFMYGEQ